MEKQIIQLTSCLDSFITTLKQLNPENRLKFMLRYENQVLSKAKEVLDLIKKGELA